MRLIDLLSEDVLSEEVSGAEQMAMFREYRNVIGAKPLFIHIEPKGSRVRVGFSAYTERPTEVRKGVSRVFDVPMRDVEVSETGDGQYTAFYTMMRGDFDKLRARYAPSQSEELESDASQVTLPDAIEAEIGMRPTMVEYDRSVGMLQFVFDVTDVDLAALSQQVAGVFGADMFGSATGDESSTVWLAIDPQDYDDLIEILSEEDTSAVGKTILKQLGGQAQLNVFLGLKSVTLGRDGVSMSFTNPRGPNLVDIRLTPNDTYLVKFYRFSGGNAKLKSEHDDVYAEDLIPLFERQTGLYIRL